MMLIERHHTLLEKLGLSTLDGVKSFQGEIIERIPGKRDVQRFRAKAESGRELVFYLKRHWRSDRKDALLSLLKQGHLWSVARVEWENARVLQAAGFHTAALVACGDEINLMGEKFSFLLTEAAAGPMTLDQFVRSGQDSTRTRHVLDSLARELQRLHQRGLSLPDLFARHIFFDPDAESIQFCFIDVARLVRRRNLSIPQQARALAALNVTAPLRFVSARERVRFLRVYAGEKELRPLVDRIASRTTRLLERKKYRDFLTPASTSDLPATGSEG